jgi:hypothetical protein
MRILDTLEVLKEHRFGLFDNPDPYLNYVKAIENAIELIELFGISDISGHDYIEMTKLLTFPNQYELNRNNNLENTNESNSNL